MYLNRQEIERKLSSRHLPTDCQKDEKLFRATLLKAASHHIPTGRRKLYTQQVRAEILAMMEEPDNLRKQYPASLPAVTNEWGDHESDIGSQKKTAERIRWEHRPQDRQHQAVEDDQRNLRQIQADGREWGHHLHRKITPHPSWFPTVSTVSSPL